MPALASAVARHLWLRHTGIRPSQYENSTLHIGVWWGRPLTPSNLRFQDFVPTAASRHHEEEQACHEQSAVEAIHLCQIYVRFVSKKNIHFISTYLSDSKRLQSTTNVCSTDRS